MTNRTEKYLSNSLILHKGFLTKLSQLGVEWTNFYIGDNNINTDDYPNHIFILLNKYSDTYFKYLKDSFDSIEEITYHYDIDDDKYMLVVELPLENLVSKFISGKYSEMYDKDQMFRLFPQEKYPRALQVVKKSPKLRHEIEESLDVTLSETAELDSIPNLNEEYYTT